MKAQSEHISGTITVSFHAYVSQNIGFKISLSRPESDWRGVIVIDGNMTWQWGPTKEEALKWMHGQIPENAVIVSEE